MQRTGEIIANYVVLALTNPVEGREEEYNKWYNEVAVPVYKTIRGFEHLGRFRLADVPKQFDFAADSKWKYLSLYRFSTENYDELVKNVEETIRNSENYYFSDGIDHNSFFEPVFVSMMDE
jgi:hypothetical protein